jgi:hypothetical protein
MAETPPTPTKKTSADKLIKTSEKKKKPDIELKEEDLKRVSGGYIKASWSPENK